MSEREINQKMAEEIRRGYRMNGQEFKRGDWIALLDGKIVAVAELLDTAFEALRAIDPDPHRGMILEVGPSPIDVIR